MHLPAGYVLRSDYVIEAATAETALGIEYRAKDLALGIPVVVKEFLPAGAAQRDHSLAVVPFGGEAGRQRFDAEKQRYLREAQGLARYKHDAIVRVYRVFEANGTVYGIYEHLDGVDMATWLASLAAPPDQAHLDRICADVLSGLELLHGDKLLHRDIRPSNIVIRRRDATPVLVNFGAAKREEVEISGVFAASNPYAAAEIYADSNLHGPWTDIYALAAVLYQAVSGRPPAIAPERMVTNAQSVLASTIPAGRYRPSFLKAIDDGLRLTPRERPQSVSEWRRALLPRLSQETADTGRAVGTKVFVSYRRADTAHLAGRVFDHLEDAFGRDEVFFDVDAIPPGVDFQDYIDTRVRQSAVVLALIGPKWLRPPPGLLQRLLGQRGGVDRVVMELQTAMRHGVPIVPVLVDGATMPDDDSLPEPIRTLSGINALSVRGGSDFRTDMARVLAVARALKSGDAGV